MTERHSLKILNALYEYDSFLDSLKSIVDMGCGTGEDILWWANLTTRDDPPRPHDYHCFAVDNDPVKLAQIPDLPNIRKLETDFNKHCLPRFVDLILAHDCLQYSVNPLETLKMWNKQMNTNGMLLISVPQHSGVGDNRFYSRGYSGCFYHYTPVNLIYMLAVNGFDCRDAYLLKQFNDPWINMAIYKSDIPPMDPATTSWYDLIDAGLLHPSIVNSINTNGFLKQEDIVMPWLDRENYFVDYVSTWTELPEGVETKVNGIINETKVSGNVSIKQGKPKTVETKMAKSVGVMRPRKKSDD